MNIRFECERQFILTKILFFEPTGWLCRFGSATPCFCVPSDRRDWQPKLREIPWPPPRYCPGWPVQIPSGREFDCLWAEVLQARGNIFRPRSSYEPAQDHL